MSRTSRRSASQDSRLGAIAEEPTVEREVLFSGVGGQGIQLAAQALARGAALEGREVTLFGVYGGSMRGGSTDSTVVVGDAPIEAAPIVSRAWSAVVMNTRYWEPGAKQGAGMARKLVDGGLVLLNSSLADDARPDTERFEVVEVPATEIAARAGRELAQTMVMLGAYARVTDVVALASLVDGMRQSLPDYRRQHAAANEEMIHAGYDVDGLPSIPFWQATHATSGTRTAS
jgi:Pyruvate/2-oxoacid:ferredoxin oxidoreductase gamma subunit